MPVIDEELFCPSIEVSVQYLRPIVVGRLVATVSVLRAGRRISQPEGALQVEGEDQPLALVWDPLAVIEG